jgi:Phage integrase family
LSAQPIVRICVERSDPRSDVYAELVDSPEHLEQEVREYLATQMPDVAVGGPLRYSSLRRRHWDPAVERAGLHGPLPVHALRHTYASLAAKAGASVKMIQTQLGHRDPALTLRVYQHLFEDDLDGLGDRLDEQFGESHAKPGRPGDGLVVFESRKSEVDNALTCEGVAPSAGFEPAAHGLGIFKKDS